MTAFTLDTGALIALERRRQRMLTFFKIARFDRNPLIVPSVCVAEWWRRRTDLREEILRAMIVEPASSEIVKTAGEAQAEVPSATAIDAIVMATAARRGEIVLTSDFDDLTALQRFFKNVRVLKV